MGFSIAPEVEARIFQLCNEHTQLSTHGNTPKIEVHAPYNTDRPTVNHGQPFIAVLKHHDNHTEIDTIGYFPILNSNEGIPTHPLFNDYLTNLTDDERDFIEFLLINQHLTTPSQSYDWSDTTYTENYIIQEINPDNIRSTGETGYPDPEDTYPGQTTPDYDFTPNRRDELINQTIDALGNFAADHADVNPEKCYTIRSTTPVDFRDRAEQLHANALPVTQPQAVSWTLHELGLSQTRIADLRQKDQSTIHNNIRRAATHYTAAQSTVDAFGTPPQTLQSTILRDVVKDIEDQKADWRFDYEKELKTDHVRCPECGYDAGEWTGGIPDGEWVGEPNQFYIASRKFDNIQTPRDPRYVECLECGHQNWRDTFHEEWVSEHGKLDYNGPEPDSTP